MAELRYDYNSIRREIARELGFDTDPANWSTKQNQDVEDTLDLGLRYYYNPPLISNERSHHRWSFLQPVGSLSLVADDDEYDLPTNFQGVTGDIVISSNNTVYSCIRQVGEGDIRSLKAQDVTSRGFPQLVAVTSFRTDLMAPTKWKAIFHPVPDASYTVTFRYLAGQERLSASNLYVLGPSSLDDYLRAAVMAACEQRMDDEKGRHWETYLERAREAIMGDRRNRQDTFPVANTDWIEGIRHGIGDPSAFFFGGRVDGDYWELMAYPQTPVIPRSIGYESITGNLYVDQDGNPYTQI